MKAAAAIGMFFAVLLVPVLLIRFRKRWLAAFNLTVGNRVTLRFAGRAAGFGIVMHVGRKSGRVYRTPVSVFRSPHGFAVALTYGPDCEWVKNVEAARRCKMETRGVVYQFNDPKVVHDPTRKSFPPLVRAILFVIGAEYFLQLSTSQP